MNTTKRSILLLAFLLVSFVAGCGRLPRSSQGAPVSSAPESGGEAQATRAAPPSLAARPLDATSTPTKTATPLPTATVTATLLPSETPTLTPAPTVTALRMQVKVRAQCRYGPGWPYLYKYGLVVGSNMEVIGRNETGAWALVQAIHGNNPCWVRADLIDIQGDLLRVAPVGYKLPMSPYYGPMKAASAVRVGNTVTVYFKRFNPGAGNDSGQYPHLIEAWLCKDGELEFTPFGTYETYAIFEDEPGCDQLSHARLYGVEKHGYTRPIEIPWPPHE